MVRPMGSVVVGLDVGGTSVKAAVVDRQGRVLRADRRPTGVAQGVDAVITGLADLAVDLVEQAGADGVTVAGVGVVVPGVVDETDGVAVYAANIGWHDVPLRSRLEQRLNLPVALGHDVRAGALAEGLVGAARDATDFLFLPIGTGIAGGIVLDGRPYAGAHTLGGEIGHTPAVPGGEVCACGQRGCLETYASAAAVARRYAAAGGTPGLGAGEIIDRTDTDPVARRVVDEAIGALATSLTTYTMVLDPDLIVIGGGMAAAGERLFGPLRAALAAGLSFHPLPPLVPAALGERAGCLGAAVLGWRVAGVAVDDLGWEPVAGPTTAGAR